MAQEEDSRPADNAVASGDCNVVPLRRGEADEAGLVLRIGRGDADAEQEFVRRFARAVSAVLRRHVHDADVARDLAQDTLLSVLLALRGRQLRTPEMLASFVLQTARNLALNAQRKRVRQATDTDMERLGACIDGARSPLERVGDAELARAVQAAIDGMGVPRDRELLRRHYLEDIEREALQAEYGLSPAQFDRVLHRARRRLRSILAGILGP
jgi:RNA polymerase sigma factor (sigma-70 family)